MMPPRITAHPGLPHDLAGHGGDVRAVEGLGRLAELAGLGLRQLLGHVECLCPLRQLLDGVEHQLRQLLNIFGGRDDGRDDGRDRVHHQDLLRGGRVAETSGALGQMAARWLSGW